MATNEKEAAAGKQKRGIFKNLRSEFRKIKWPDRKTVIRQTIAVVVCAICLGLLIAFLDMIIKVGLNVIL